MTGRQWCRTCRRTAKVVDTFTESNYEPGGEYSYRVTELACGHDVESTPVRVGPAPGAPKVVGAFPNLEALMRHDAWDVSA